LRCQRVSQQQQPQQQKMTQRNSSRKNGKGQQNQWIELPKHVFLKKKKTHRAKTENSLNNKPKKANLLKT
jgi:hypothetical protein